MASVEQGQKLDQLHRRLSFIRERPKSTTDDPVLSQVKRPEKVTYYTDKIAEARRSCYSWRGV